MKKKKDLPAKPENRFLGMLAGYAIILATRDSDNKAFPYRAGELIVAKNGTAYYVRQPGLLALIYALNVLEHEVLDEPLRAYRAIVEPASVLIEESADPIEFPGWKVLDYVALEQVCRSDALFIPFSEKFESFERWLELSLGELVFYALPELWPQMLKDVERKLRFAFDSGHIEGQMCNVVAPLQRFPAMWEHYGVLELK